jgi:putative ABC transport system permease protein
LTGLAAGFVAALTATGASYGVARYILHTEWGFSWPILIFTLAGGLATMLVFGYAGLNATVRARPAQLLRNE